MLFVSYGGRGIDAWQLESYREDELRICFTGSSDPFRNRMAALVSGVVGKLSPCCRALWHCESLELVSENNCFVNGFLFASAIGRVCNENFVIATHLLPSIDARISATEWFNSFVARQFVGSAIEHILHSLFFQRYLIKPSSTCHLTHST